jgi:Nuclease subunit of the excinuclease complex
MATKNAQQTLELELFRNDDDADAKSERILTTLKEELEIEHLPRRIECFDISNIQGTDNVASMVVFERAAPKKSDYRTFKIKSVEGEPNDFASMKEVVGRRYSRLLDEGKTFPDLIIIDGGKGQLSAAMEALGELEEKGLDWTGFSIVGLAKKQEEVFSRTAPTQCCCRAAAKHCSFSKE